MCHISYPRKDSPFPMALSRCLSCKKHNVPEILLTTVELPKELKTVGEGRLIEAHGKIFKLFYEQFVAKRKSGLAIQEQFMYQSLFPSASMRFIVNLLINCVSLG